MGLQGTPGPSHGGAHVPNKGAPFKFIFCLSHMRGAAACPPQASRVPQPSGKAAPTAPGCYGATGRDAPDGNMVAGALWVLPGPPLCSKAMYRGRCRPPHGGGHWHSQGVPRPPHALGRRSDQGRAIWRWGLRGGHTGGRRPLACGHRAVCGKEPASFLARGRCYADHTGSRRSPGASVSRTPTSQAHVVRAIAPPLS